MQKGSRGRSLIAEGVDMGHHVVPQLALVFVGGGEVDRVDMGPQLFDLRLRDGEPHLRFGFGEPDPQLPPGAVFALSAPELAHFSGGVTGFERVFVAIVRHGAVCKSSRGSTTRQNGTTNLPF